jgi:hypothetical protein
MEKNIMSFEEFRDLLNIWGCNKDAWPDGQRPAAEELLVRSQDAQALFDETMVFDAMLSMLPSADEVRNPQIRSKILSLALGDESTSSKKAPIKTPSPSFPKFVKSLPAFAAGLILIVGIGVSALLLYEDNRFSSDERATYPTGSTSTGLAFRTPIISFPLGASLSGDYAPNLTLSNDSLSITRNSSLPDERERYHLF